MDDRLHVVGVVGNDVVFDTRIKKVAAAAAAAGYRSTILCYTPSGVRRTSRMGDVEVIRVPVPFTAHAKNGRIPGLLRPFNAAELAARHAGPRAHLTARKRWLQGEINDPSIAGLRRLSLRLLHTWVRASLWLRHTAFRLRRRAHVELDRWIRAARRLGVRTRVRLLAPFRDPVPNIADYEVAFGEILEELEPDLIHAHDYHMIGIAVTAARNLRKHGHSTKVLYDAHEWIEGLSYHPRILRGWLRLERRFIHHVDAVTAVSPEQAAQIQDRYALPATPTVVLNAPVVHGTQQSSSDIRADVGGSGPIVVYHGNVFVERGLGTLIEALPLLGSDVRIAILAPKDHPETDAVRRLAGELGVADRVHLLGYVPAEQLPVYLSTADLAVVPYLFTGNNDIALPNKLFESLQAGLPLLVSDMRSMSRLVSEHGVGEVFRAGDAEDLAEKARLILDDPGRYRWRITEDIKAEFRWDSQARRLLEVYARLLGREPPTTVHISPAEITEQASGPRTDRPTRLLVGPRNMAGQAFAIAAAVQERLGIPALALSVEKPHYGFPTHVQVSEDEWRDPSWQAAQRRFLAGGITHVIAESGTGILGSLNGGFIDEQLDVLREDGVRVAVLLHGSEIRDPRRHRLLPYSPYAIDDQLTRSIEQASSRLRTHLARLRGFDVPLFVTTPDLLADVNATWLPVVVDVDRWGALQEPGRGELPTILHLPSNGRLKGSPYVDEVVSELAAAGAVRYLRPERVGASDVERLVEEADIVVDQVVIGAYGVMSCQAMAAGRIVVANIRDIGSLRDECPIVHADPGSLRAVLLDLLDRTAEWKERGEAGRRFAARYHDGAETARVLQGFLDKR